ncbi:lactate utilization protein C [Deinococcus malanensis]|uniref:Lactate utilization protein C n=1 Tax=Deinococcus malanensis TaxID=1706855 RepID=A0ABQ2F0L8_9DEIO|nr:lactate utilization protein C [Deinococcus malanensis]GGK38870.1 lactate utilization protein C [Deinococcus malanensis]
MSAEAKLEILTRINRAGQHAEASFVRAPVGLSTRTRQDVVEQFAEYAAEYRANVIRVDYAGLAQAIQDRLDLCGSERVAIPQDLPAGWLPQGASFTADQAGVTDLTDIQSVITACAVAIAETGTVVLDHGPGQGRRALTLVPDHHICVVRESQVMDSLPEAVAQLKASVGLGLPLTWISGPSATSDIELSRVEGVHGPRVLDIMLVHEHPDGTA